MLQGLNGPRRPGTSPGPTWSTSSPGCRCSWTAGLERRCLIGDTPPVPKRRIDKVATRAGDRHPQRIQEHPSPPSTVATLFVMDAMLNSRCRGWTLACRGRTEVVRWHCLATLHAAAELAERRLRPGLKGWGTFQRPQSAWSGRAAGRSMGSFVWHCWASDCTMALPTPRTSI